MSSITNILIKSTPNTLPKRISAAEKINKRIKRPSDELAERESSEASSKFAQAVKQLPAYDVENLGFALMSNEDREALAITAITSSDKTKNPQCINSSDMGSTSRTDICPTCKLRYPDCSGHYGLIKLPTPIFNPLFKKMMIDVMSVICHHCGEIKVPPESIKSYGILSLPPRQRLPALIDINKEKDSTTCPNPYCYKISPAVKKGDLSPNKIVRDSDSPLTIEQVQSLFDKRRFTADKAAVLGFTEGAHPGNMIMRNLLVIPEQLRRDFRVDGNTKHSDLTNAYASIVNECNSYTNDRIKGISNEALQNRVERISNAIANLFTHPETTNGKDVKGILEQFKTKEGISRQGRRTNNNARAVVGPGPLLKFGEVGIPREIAKALLTKVRVTKYNINMARAFIAKGQVVFIVKNGKDFKTLVKNETRMEQSRSIEIGDIIFRHMIDGDIVIMNRQPTIEKLSLQGYSGKITDQRTITVSLPSTGAHNMDFDGDEGNIYGVVGLESMAEVMEILHSTNNIVSGQSGKPAVGLVMNALSGGYALTSKNIVVSRSDMQNAYNTVSPNFSFKSFCERALKRGGSMYSDIDGTIVKVSDIDVIPDYYDGKLYFSVCLPDTFQYRRGDVLIQDGIMLSGQLTKEHIGASTGSIIQVINTDYGRDITAKFVTDSTHILDEYARKRGISVGIYDYCPTIGSQVKKEDLEEARYRILSELKNKILDLPEVEDCNVEMKKRIENKTVEYMETATNDIGVKILREFIEPNSGLTIMANSGAKGTPSNVAHTIGSIGPQYERGYRIQNAITGGTRTTPYFIPNDKDVEARGFVFRNYGEGVTPADAAHMSVPTRTSIVDTAVGISVAGYLARSMARFFEDIMVSYSGGIVLNAEIPGSKTSGVKRVVSFMYGDDGFDTSKLEMVKTPIGDVFLPINLDRLASKINAKHGVFDSAYGIAPYTGPIEYE